MATHAENVDAEDGSPEPFIIIVSPGDTSSSTLVTASIEEDPRATEKSMRKLARDLDAAQSNVEHEQGMSLRYTVRHYYPAIIWAMLMAAPIITEGYQALLLPHLFSLAQFGSHYGNCISISHNSNCSDQTAKISPVWQSGIAAGSCCGQLLGLGLTPRIIDRLGHRRAMLSALIWAACSIMIDFTSSFVPEHGLPIFLIGEVLLGIAVGLFQGSALPYISELVPPKLNNLTVACNIFWLSGAVLCCAVLRATLS